MVLSVISCVGYSEIRSVFYNYSNGTISYSRIGSLFFISKLEKDSIRSLYHSSITHILDNIYGTNPKENLCSAKHLPLKRSS